MPDMQAIQARIKALWEPAGTGAKVQYSRDSFTDLFAPNVHAFASGTWFLAGHHQGLPAIKKLLEGVHKLWPDRASFHNNNYWAGDDTLCVEWFSANGNWKGQRCRNSGMTIWKFEGEQIVDWQEITDSEYFEEAHAGWREHFGSELGRHIPMYRVSGPSWYPNPAEHAWELDTCTTDGRATVPPHMRSNVERVQEWWKAPRKGSSALFADDLHVYFQGRSWPLGGHHRGRQGLERIFEGAKRIWPEPPTIVKTNLWANDDRVLVQWFTKSRTWKDQPCRNSGWTVWKFAGDKVVDWRMYTDTSYYAELTAGWREAFSEAFGSQLPNWQLPHGPRYPRLEEHE
jgi:ketosteroid isomerase-like protein